MNPMLSGIVMAIVRYVLAGLMAAAVQRGILTPDQTEYLIAGAAGFVGVVLWALWVKYRDRLKLTTAMAMPSQVSEKQVEAAVKAGNAPPVTLSKDQPVRPMGSINPPFQ